jgi:hypothetical protein
VSWINAVEFRHRNLVCEFQCSRKIILFQFSFFVFSTDIKFFGVATFCVTEEVKKHQNFPGWVPSQQVIRRSLIWALRSEKEDILTTRFVSPLKLRSNCRISLRSVKPYSLVLTKSNSQLLKHDLRFLKSLQIGNETKLADSSALQSRKLSFIVRMTSAKLTTLSWFQTNAASRFVLDKREKHLKRNWKRSCQLLSLKLQTKPRHYLFEEIIAQILLENTSIVPLSLHVSEGVFTRLQCNSSSPAIFSRLHALKTELGFCFNSLPTSLEWLVQLQDLDLQIDLGSLSAATANKIKSEIGIPSRCPKLKIIFSTRAFEFRSVSHLLARFRQVAVQLSLVERSAGLSQTGSEDWEPIFQIVFAEMPKLTKLGLELETIPRLSKEFSAQHSQLVPKFSVTFQARQEDLSPYVPILELLSRQSRVLNLICKGSLCSNVLQFPEFFRSFPVEELQFANLFF